MTVSIDQRTPDIRIGQNRYFPKYSVTCDWVLLDNGELDASQALATAVIAALGSNALAAPDDLLPDPDSEDREGWCLDFDSELVWDGWPLGSKLWLLRRSSLYSVESLYGSTMAMVKNYIHDAIQPFIERGIASAYEIATTRESPQQINAVIRMFRGPKPAVDLRYQILWADIQERSIAVDPYQNRYTP